MISTFIETKDDGDSDDYLIELMGLRNDFPEEARIAYGKIYIRYWKVMYKIALGVTRDPDQAADLLSDTFNVIFHRAGSFSIKKIRNPSNIRLAIQKWMTQIMKHIFFDHYLDDAYKNNDDEKLPEECYIVDKRFVAQRVDESYEDFIDTLHREEGSETIDVPSLENDVVDTENIRKVKDYIDRLAERERDIVLTVYSYYVPGKNTPSDVLDGLVHKWGTTRDNIRKIMEKFRKSIKQELQAKIYVRK